MAISQDLWNKAKEYFEAGLSLTEIVDRTKKETLDICFIL
jgi:hypothetical protein